ncbi:MAG: glycosyltransferase family 2 protein [Clostridiaceae bacterium]|jgi:dolichol-phosphate mannosyltransferase|nr:glycosyltransferase family 2 protein [Oscillospiraceae bacterium]NLO63037.1 glycosyltransferase family 2 protein [Clostridiaceae bacterium]
MDLIVLMPFYNEEKQIPVTVNRMIPLLDALDLRYSLLLVNDGSSDGTWKAIEDASDRHYGKVRGISLSRNFGKEAAICAGLDVADADAVILMDGDLQHPPECIPEMIRLWREEGYEIVEGVKSDRGREGVFSRLQAKLFYSMFRRMSGYDLSNASDYKLLDRKVVLKWRTLGEHNTFFRGLSAWLGFRRVSFPFEVAERQTGRSRWKISSLLRLSVHAIVSFSAIPLHLISFIGAIFLIGTLILLIQTLVNYFSGGAADGFTTVIIVTLAIGACVMISLGLIGTYVALIFDEVKNRPRYIISEDTGVARDGDTESQTAKKES